MAKRKSTTVPAGSEPSFEVYRDKSGEFRFRLRGANGRILVESSESYRRYSGAEGGIDAVRREVLQMGTPEPLRPKAKPKLKPVPPPPVEPGFDANYNRA